MSRRLFAALALVALAAPATAQDAPVPAALQGLTCAQLMAKYDEIRTSFSEEKETAVMDDVAKAKAAQAANNEAECKARLIKVLSLP